MIIRLSSCSLYLRLINTFILLLKIVISCYFPFEFDLFLSFILCEWLIPLIFPLKSRPIASANEKNVKHCTPRSCRSVFFCALLFLSIGNFNTYCILGNICDHMCFLLQVNSTYCSFFKMRNIFRCKALLTPDSGHRLNSVVLSRSCSWHGICQRREVTFSRTSKRTKHRWAQWHWVSWTFFVSHGVCL